MDRNEQLQTYQRELLRWTAKVNLIGPDARLHLDEHVHEALAAADFLQPSGEVLDFGSGGGLPAIPLAIEAPAAHVHLVEADRKKWAFLKHVVRECHLNCQVHGDRLHAVLQQLESSLRFSLVTSRAVGYPERWVPEVAERLESGGRVALFQGDETVPEIAGLRHSATFRLPRGTNNYLVVLQRTS